MNYNGALTREQFMFQEMRIIARLRIKGFSDQEILDRVFQENLFQSYAEDKKDYEERTKNYRTIPLSLAEARKLAEESEFIKQIIKF